LFVHKEGHVVRYVRFDSTLSSRRNFVACISLCPSDKPYRLRA